MDWNAAALELAEASDRLREGDHEHLCLIEHLVSNALIKIRAELHAQMSERVRTLAETEASKRMITDEQGRRHLPASRDKPKAPKEPRKARWLDEALDDLPG